MAFTLLAVSAIAAIAGVALAWMVYGRDRRCEAASIGVARNPLTSC